MDCMDWITDIQKAINYIENNLLENINVDDISKYIYISSDHFQRMFNMVVGFSVSEYIKNRKLSLAAQELYLKKSKVIDVALKYGYDTHESFTKAFLRFHNVTPSDVRKSRRNIKYFFPLSIQINIKGGFIMSKKVIPSLGKFMDGMNGENYEFCGAMAQLMATLDEKDYDYWFFTCITGDTFTQVYSKDNQKNFTCLSSAVFGKEYLDKVFKACGYDYEYADNRQFFSNKEKYIAKIIEWINKGIPVVVKDNSYSWFSLAVGYEENGDILKLNLWDGKIENYTFNITENTNYGLIFTGEKKTNPDLGETYRAAIYDIPNLITKKATADACFGKEAFVEWANGLTDGRYDNIPEDKLDIGNVHSNNLINFGTNGCMKKFIKRVSDLNPDMKELINSLYGISAETDEIFHFLAGKGGFEYNGETMKKREENELLSGRIKENLAYCDKILALFESKN